VREARPDRTQRLKEAAIVEIATIVENRNRRMAEIETLEEMLELAQSPWWDKFIKVWVPHRLKFIMEARMQTPPDDQIHNASMYGQFLERRYDLEYLSDIQSKLTQMRVQVAIDNEQIQKLEKRT